MEAMGVAVTHTPASLRVSRGYPTRSAFVAAMPKRSRISDETLRRLEGGGSVSLRIVSRVASKLGVPLSAYIVAWEGVRRKGGRSS